MTVSTLRSLFPARSVFCILVMAGLGGCRAVGESYSPWTTGLGVKVSPAFALGEAEDGPTVHPSIAYSRMEGGFNWVEAGAQIRWPLSLGEQEIWAGAEVMVGRSGTTGIAGNALIGVPIGDSRWNPSLFASAGISRYGNTGRVLSVGVDVQPWFFPR